MSYDGIIMQRAIARFDQARQRREAELDQRRREVFARQPRLRDIDRTLRTTMSRIVAAAAKKGEDPLPALRVLRDENLSLQRERAALLEDMGYPADYLEDKPACSLCGDTGYTRSGVCACLKQYYAREQLAELSRLLPLGEARFDTFRFDLYDSAVWDSYGVSPRANMERNFDVCGTLPASSPGAAAACCSPAAPVWARRSSPPASPGRSATPASPWSTTPRSAFSPAMRTPNSVPTRSAMPTSAAARAATC